MAQGVRRYRSHYRSILDGKRTLHASASADDPLNFIINDISFYDVLNLIFSLLRTLTRKRRTHMQKLMIKESKPGAKASSRSASVPTHMSNEW
jgi:hypothetical protein